MPMTDDDRYMMMALDLGLQARTLAPPNPWVGCLIVKENTIIGQGWSQPAGQAHAEVVALKMAGDKAHGSTVYVTLEPCSHTGRTPPCTEALVRAKVRRIVVGVLDPDPRVAGSGITFLRQQGITVEMSSLEQEVAASLQPYLHQRRTGLPYVIAKAAVSLDGRLAAQDGSSQWISTPEARADAHRLRAESQAIFIGVGTALADHPSLTVRDYPAPYKQPLRVVLDPHGKLTMTCPLLDLSLAQTLIFTSKTCSESTLALWREKEIPYIKLDMMEGKLPLKEILQHLGRQGIIQVLVEGGSKVLGNFLEQRLIDLLVLHIGPKVLGNSGLSLFNGLTVLNMASAIEMHLLEVRQLGQTVCVTYRV